MKPVMRERLVPVDGNENTEQWWTWSANGNTTNVNRPSVSIPIACEVAGVSRRTIYNWLAKNKVEWWRTAGGSVRIARETLFIVPGQQVET